MNDNSQPQLPVGTDDDKFNSIAGLDDMANLLIGDDFPDMVGFDADKSGVPLMLLGDDGHTVGDAADDASVPQGLDPVEQAVLQLRTVLQEEADRPLEDNGYVSPSAVVAPYMPGADLAADNARQQAAPQPAPGHELTLPQNPEHAPTANPAAAPDSPTFNNQGLYPLEDALLNYPVTPLTGHDNAANHAGQLGQAVQSNALPNYPVGVLAGQNNAANQVVQMGQRAQNSALAGGNALALGQLLQQLQDMLSRHNAGGGLNSVNPQAPAPFRQGAAQTQTPVQFIQSAQRNLQSQIDPQAQLNALGQVMPGLVVDPGLAETSQQPQLNLLTQVNQESPDRLLHNRRNKFDPDNDPSRFYLAPTGLGPWGPVVGRNQPRRLFEYFRTTAELNPLVSYTKDELVAFFLGRGHPNPNRRLTLWIQNVPAQANHRYPNQACSTKCRYKHCPGIQRTILTGWLRVAFDEFSDQTGVTLDPFHNAGYMHLHCFEMLFDLGYLMHYSRSRHGFEIRADTRRFVHEARNPAALARDHVAMLTAFQDWKNSHKARADHVEAQNRRASSPAQLYTGFELQTVPPHEQRLGFLLTDTHVRSEMSNRQRVRDRRGGAHIGLHRGDLELFNKLKRREARKKQGHHSDSSAEEREERLEQARRRLARELRSISPPPRPSGRHKRRNPTPEQQEAAGAGRKRPRTEAADTIHVAVPNPANTIQRAAANHDPDWDIYDASPRQTPPRPLPGERGPISVPAATAAAAPQGNLTLPQIDPNLLGPNLIHPVLTTAPQLTLPQVTPAATAPQLTLPRVPVNTTSGPRTRKRAREEQEQEQLQLQMQRRQRLDQQLQQQHAMQQQVRHQPRRRQRQQQQQYVDQRGGRLHYDPRYDLLQAEDDRLGERIGRLNQRQRREVEKVVRRKEGEGGGRRVQSF
ncbi:hypothetical protein VTI74DRAFT_2905 [Chaetomium olivicolor]